MCDCEDMSGGGLACHPTLDPGHQMHQGITTMRGGIGVGQPLGQSFRIVRLNMVDLLTAPAPIVDICQLQLHRGRKAERLRGLLCSPFGSTVDVLSCWSHPTECRYLFELSIHQGFVEREGCPPQREG